MVKCSFVVVGLVAIRRRSCGIIGDLHVFAPLLLKDEVVCFVDPSSSATSFVVSSMKSSNGSRSDGMVFCSFVACS